MRLRKTPSPKLGLALTVVSSASLESARYPRVIRDYGARKKYHLPPRDKCSTKVGKDLQTVSRLGGGGIGGLPGGKLIGRGPTERKGVTNTVPPENPVTGWGD